MTSAPTAPVSRLDRIMNTIVFSALGALVVLALFPIINQAQTVAVAKHFGTDDNSPSTWWLTLLTLVALGGLVLAGFCLAQIFSDLRCDYAEGKPLSGRWIGAFIALTAASVAVGYILVRTVL